MENQYRLGLVAHGARIRERMSSVEIDTVMPQDLINASWRRRRCANSSVPSQLSQFMDQTNPLSKVTHKRRLSALGPGGLTRERAGFEVRDVHPTHYGRICPIETPEGPNIGLINSLPPSRAVNSTASSRPRTAWSDGKVTTMVVYHLGDGEAATASRRPTPTLDEDGVCGRADHLPAAPATSVSPADEVDLMDVSPKQLVSVAAALIPFLENDDANRALMGSNMQRQAVPLLRAEAPFVGTGMEGVVARDFRRRDPLAAAASSTRSTRTRSLSAPPRRPGSDQSRASTSTA